MEPIDKQLRLQKGLYKLTAGLIIVGVFVVPTGVIFAVRYVLPQREQAGIQESSVPQINEQLYQRVIEELAKKRPVQSLIDSTSVVVAQTEVGKADPFSP